MAKEPGDSGMASFDEGSKDVTPEKPKAIVADESDDEVGLSYYRYSITLPLNIRKKLYTYVYYQQILNIC